MATKKVKFNSFNGGIANDVYKAATNQFAFAKHLDNINQKGRLRPYRSLVDEQAGQTNIGAFHYASDGNLYGLGAAPSTQQIYKFSGFGSGWAPVVNGAGPNVTIYQMFFEHQQYLYFWGGNGSIGRYNITTQTMTANWFVVGTGATKFSCGFRYPLNDRAYFAFGNQLYYINKATDTPVLAFSVPDDLKIVSISFWENYLAVGCASKNLNGQSKVFFWDTFSAFAAFVKEIPEGRLNLIRNVGGALACICTNAGTTININMRMYAYVFSGGSFSKESEYVAYGNNSIQLVERAARVDNNQLFFGASVGVVVGPQITNQGAGVWRFGINNGSWCLTLDRFTTNNNSEETIHDIELYGDYVFAIPTSYGLITRTNDQPAYGVTAIYETAKIGQSDSESLNKIRSIGVSTIKPTNEIYNPTPARIDVYTKTDDESSYLFIGSHFPDSANFTEITQQSTDVNFPTFHFVSIKLEFHGLSQLTELAVVYEDQPQLYMS